MGCINILNMATELGPVRYNTLKTVYGVGGFGYGAFWGALVGTALAFIASESGAGIMHVVGSPESNQDIVNTFHAYTIVAGGFGGLIGGAIGNSSAMKEFHSDFTKRPRR